MGVAVGREQASSHQKRKRGVSSACAISTLFEFLPLQATCSPHLAPDLRRANHVALAMSLIMSRVAINAVIVFWPGTI